MGALPTGVAITPDGTHAYVANEVSNTVSVIATATNTVVATVAVGNTPSAVAVTPDGTHAYVANFGGNSDSVSGIATATNAVTATVAVGNGPRGVAITPDGTKAYVANQGSNSVSVIATATNTVTATVAVGNSPVAVGIVPPPATVPFLAFNAALEIHFGRKPNQVAFALESSFTLSSTAPAINPVTQPVTLQAGTFATTIPPGSFKQTGRLFTFAGVINGVSLQAAITPTGTLRYAFVAVAEGASLTGTANPVTVGLSIGADSGTTSVTALIFH